MKVSVEEVSTIERKLSIEVDPTRVAEELTRAYAALSRQVKVAGFRPGKVPRRILEQRFRDQVEGDVIQKVVEKAYFEAIREHKVDAVGSPQVKNDRLRPDAPFQFEARVEVKPKVDAKDYKGLPLKRIDVKIEDAQVDEQLERMRQSMSRLEPVSGRDVVQDGDYVLIDFVATEGGKPFAGSTGENVTVEAVAGELIAGKIGELQGATVGTSKELDYTFPADYQVDAVKGKVGHFVIQVKGIKTRIVPEVNDDFAKDTGAGVETIDALKAKLRTDMEKAERTKLEGEERDVLFKALIERNPLEVPRAMVNRAIQMMLQGALRSVSRSGVDPSQLGLDMNKLGEDMRPRATDEVKGSLLLESIAQKESIAPTEAEQEQKIESLAAESGQAVSSVRQYFKTAENKQGLFFRLREEKTIEFLKSQASYQ